MEIVAKITDMNMTITTGGSVLTVARGIHIRFIHIRDERRMRRAMSLLIAWAKRNPLPEEKP